MARFPAPCAQALVGVLCTTLCGAWSTTQEAMRSGGESVVHQMQPSRSVWSALGPPQRRRPLGLRKPLTLFTYCIISVAVLQVTSYKNTITIECLRRKWFVLRSVAGSRSCTARSFPVRRRSSRSSASRVTRAGAPRWLTRSRISRRVEESERPVEDRWSGFREGRSFFRCQRCRGMASAPSR